MYNLSLNEELHSKSFIFPSNFSSSRAFHVYIKLERSEEGKIDIVSFCWWCSFLFEYNFWNMILSRVSAAMATIFIIFFSMPIGVLVFIISYMEQLSFHTCELVNFPKNNYNSLKIYSLRILSSPMIFN